MAENSEKALTPDEYLRNAYNRIIAIGNAVVAGWPKITYDPNVNYLFKFDRNCIYRFVSTDKDGYSTFLRDKPNHKGGPAYLVMTKYGERPEINS